MFEYTDIMKHAKLKVLNKCDADRNARDESISFTNF